MIATFYSTKLFSKIFAFFDSFKCGTFFRYIKKNFFLIFIFINFKICASLKTIGTISTKKLYLE